MKIFSQSIIIDAYGFSKKNLTEKKQETKSLAVVYYYYLFDFVIIVTIP